MKLTVIFSRFMVWDLTSELQNKYPGTCVSWRALGLENSCYLARWEEMVLQK